MLPGSHSLVKYNTPLLVSTTKDSKGRKKKQLPPVNDKKTTQTEDILNSILPPRFIYFLIIIWSAFVRVVLGCLDGNRHCPTSADRATAKQFCPFALTLQHHTHT